MQNALVIFLFVLFSGFVSGQTANEISIDLGTGTKKFDLEFGEKEFAEKTKLVIVNTQKTLYKWQVTITDGKKTKVEVQYPKGGSEVPVTHQKHLKSKGRMIFELFSYNEKTKIELIFCTVIIKLK